MATAPFAVSCSCASPAARAIAGRKDNSAMFKIGSQRLTWMAVKWRGLLEDGSPVENEIRCQVELVDRAVLKAQTDSERDGQAESLAFARRVMKDWSGVGDASGASLPYRPANLDLIWEVPGFAGGAATEPHPAVAMARAAPPRTAAIRLRRAFMGSPLLEAEEGERPKILIRHLPRSS